MLLDLTTGDIIIGLEPAPITIMPVYSTNPVVNGTWRIIGANGGISFQKLVAGVWIEYNFINDQ